MRLWDIMSANEDLLVNNVYEGVERVRKSNGDYAFFLESTFNEYVNERLPCDTMRVGENLDAKGYGVVTAKNSPYRYS